MRPLVTDLREVIDTQEECVAVYTPGHVRKDEFFRAVVGHYDPDVEQEQVYHAWWRAVKASGGPLDELFFVAREGDAGAFPVTAIDIQPWNNEQNDTPVPSASDMARPATDAGGPGAGWIPVAETPLPEKGEALVEYASGGRDYWDCLRNCFRRGDVVAYQMIKPFVPPEPEKPKRRRGVIGVTKGCGAHWHSDIGLPEGVTIDVCEVLPGDVDPDAARKAREICEGIIAGSPTPNARTVAASDILRILNEKQT